jgi:putative ABC transport system permease protein
MTRLRDGSAVRLRSLLAESARTAAAQRVTSVLVAVLCAAMCSVTMLTVGSTAAAEAQVLSRIDSAGSRLLVVTDKKNAGLVTPAVVDMLGGLDTVDRVLGVDRPFDVTNQAIGDGGFRAAAWRLLGAIPAAVTLIDGRWPQPGEALVSSSGQRTLGLASPAGAVTSFEGHEYPVVGSFAARSPFEFLNDGLLVVPMKDDLSAVNALFVVVASASAAQTTERTVIEALGPTDLAGLTIQSPNALADLQQVIGGDLGGFSHQLLLVTLGAGAFLLAVVTLAEVLLRRRDLGRRRALGATRLGLVTLVVARTTLPALPGVAVGLLVGGLLAARMSQLPPWDFIAGTGTLTLITAALAAVPPAVVASRRDPVAVLRTP